MQVWTWFLVPPAVLAAAFYFGDSVVPTPAAPPPPPAVQPLSLSPTIEAWAAAPQPLLVAQAPEPRDIRLAAFGVLTPAELDRVRAAELARLVAAAPLPRANELFRLESVLVTGDKRLAVINGSVFQAGEQIARRYRLVEVRPDQVWLQGPRGREALSFPEWRDAPLALELPRPPQAGQPPASASPGSAPRTNPAARLESEYRKILEMLKL